MAAAVQGVVQPKHREVWTGRRPDIPQDETQEEKAARTKGELDHNLRPLVRAFEALFLAGAEKEARVMLGRINNIIKQRGLDRVQVFSGVKGVTNGFVR